MSLLTAVAVVALGGAFAFWPPDPAASESMSESMSRSMSATEGVAQALAPVPGLERLVVYGHSMPTGVGASDLALGYAEVAAEVTRLQLLNRAEGRTSAGAAARAMATFFKAGPEDAVVIHTGMNDILRRGDAAAAMGRKAIGAMLARTQGAGRTVLLLECQPPSWHDTPARRELQPAYETWNAMLRSEARRAPHVEVLDTCSTWVPEQFHDAGEFHPDDTGQR